MSTFKQSSEAGFRGHLGRRLVVLIAVVVLAIGAMTAVVVGATGSGSAAVTKASATTAGVATPSPGLGALARAHLRHEAEALRSSTP